MIHREKKNSNRDIRRIAQYEDHMRMSRKNKLRYHDIQYLQCGAPQL